MSTATTEAEVIEATVQEVGAELVAQPEASTATLFQTDDPVQVLDKATAIASALKRVLDHQKLTVSIQGNEHVKVEGWQTLGAMLGVTPVCVWTKPIAEPSKGWEARVEARTLDGRVIGSAEAMCERSEKRWARADDYAIRSMAQTRATSKALASPLRFIVTLAGYSGTPAEEMPGDPAPPTEDAQAAPDPQAPRIDADRAKKILGGFAALKLSYGRIGALLATCRISGLRASSQKAVLERVESLTEQEAVKLEAALERLAQDEAAEAPQGDPADV